MMLIIKRDGSQVPFNKTKIKQAVMKAMKNGSGIVLPDIARLVANDAERCFSKQDASPTIHQIEKYVFERLMHYGQGHTARSYEGYRAVQEYKRMANTTDKSIMGLVESINEEVLKENSNKNGVLVSTQRDLIAGEVSKDIVERKMYPPHITQAHKEGAIHQHDKDYLLQKMFNCCLPDLENMLKYGTVINDKMIETPKSFQTACTVSTQILSAIASSQYGGTSVNGIDRILAPYVRKSYEKYLAETLAEQLEIYQLENPNISIAKKIAWKRTRKEVQAGIQTIQYQINTLNSSNGQSPFVTLLMHFDPKSEYAEESALITEEILKQRLKGIKNEKGVYITPSFPKLIYVLDEHNIHPDSQYYYLTELSAKCTAKRMYPKTI